MVFEKKKNQKNPKKTKTNKKTLTTITQTNEQTNKETEAICEVVTPQRQDEIWSSPLAMLFLKLRTAGFLRLRIE